MIVITLVVIVAAVPGARRARRFARAQTEGPNDLLRAGAPAGTDDRAVAVRREEGK